MINRRDRERLSNFETLTRKEKMLYFRRLERDWKSGTTCFILFFLLIVFSITGSGVSEALGGETIILNLETILTLFLAILFCFITIDVIYYIFLVIIILLTKIIFSDWFTKKERGELKKINEKFKELHEKNAE